MPYSDLIMQESEYTYSANIQFDIENDRKLLRFIPNDTTTALLKEYFTDITRQNPENHARILYGSYGTGKSHFLTVLSLLLSKSHTDGFAFETFTDRLSRYDAGLASDIASFVHNPARKPFLVVPIVFDFEDFDRCIYFSLKKKLDGLDIPVQFKTFYDQATQLIEQWKSAADSKKRLEEACNAAKIKLPTLEAQLHRYDKRAEKRFQRLFSVMTYGVTYVYEKHNNLEFLLYCVACIKWGEDTDMFSKLETVFDRETASMGFNELINLVKEIKEYADIFKKYILDLEKALEDEQDLYFRYDDKIRGLLLILQKFGIQMFYPYVIMRLKEVNQNESDPQLREDFQILESFVVRRKLSPKGTHDYTSKCYEIIKHKIGVLIQSDLGNRDAGLTDADIKRYLSNTKDDTAKMVLFWIELRRRRGDAYDINALEYNYTLEHIMPKKWKTHWSEVPIVDGKTVYDKDSDDGIHYRDSMIQSIGNKTLLKSSLNSAVKNADFMTKIKGIDGRRPGYDQHTALMLTRDLVAKSQTDQNWDEKHISDRTNQLFGEFVQIWPSFADRVQVSAPISDEDPNIDQFTQEQLSDAALLAEIL